MIRTERVCRVDASVTERPVAAPAATVASPRSRPGAARVSAAVVVIAAVAVDPAGIRTFTSLRWFLVSTSVALAALMTVRALRRGHTPPVQLPHSFVVAGSVVLVSMPVSAAVVGEPATAWLGHPQRHLGVLAWMVFGAAALTGAALARTAAHHRALALGAAVAAGATGLTAVVDLAGWEPLGTSFAGGRIGGLFGQPTTLGAFAVLVLPLAAIAPLSLRLRLLSVGGLVAALLGSQTRGALVGLLAAGIVSFPVFGTKLHRRHVLWVLLAGALLSITPAGARLLSSADSSRLDDWNLAMDVIAENPVLGTGPEGYRLAVVGALDDEYVDQHGREVVIDRAHSAPLDVAVTGGVLAGVAYVVLVGGVAVSTWRLQRRTPWSIPAAAGTGAVGFLVAGFFAFPTPGVDAVAWMFAGLAVAAAHRLSARPTMRVPFRGRMAPATAAILVAVTLAAGATDVVADRWLATAVDFAAAGRTDDAVASADRATALRPDLVDAWYLAASVAATGETILDLDAGIERVRSGLRRSPDDPALRGLHSRLLAERYLRTGLVRDRRIALATLDALLDADPTNVDAARLRAEVIDAPSTPALDAGS